MSRGSRIAREPRRLDRRSLIACALLAAACAEPSKRESLPVEATASRVDVYIQAIGPQSEQVVMEVDAVRLEDDLGEQVELPLRISTVASDGQRALIAGGIVEPSGYQKLILSVRAAYLSAAGTRVPLRLLDGEADAAALDPGPPLAENAGAAYEVPISVRLRRHDAAAVFLNWQVDASVTGRSGFRPVFDTSLEQPRVTLGLMYVTDATTSSVLAIERATGEVVATIKVGARPLGVDISRDRRRLFVANGRDGSLSVIDLRQGFAISTIPIRLGSGACDVVVAAPPDVVAVANKDLDTVSFFDTLRSVRTADVKVGQGPVRLAAAERLRRLFVVNSKADTLTAIDVNSRSAVASIPLEANPTDLAVDRRQREIFVGHRTSRNLLVVNATDLTVVESIYVGGNVTAVLADRRRDRVYVARSSPDELVVVDRRVAAVVKRIPIDGRVESLAQPVDGPNVYGAAPALGQLIVVNVITGRAEESIPAGASPTDVAVTD